MSIIQFYKKFPTRQDCLNHLEKIRWNGTPSCPYCKSSKNTPMNKENRYHCLNCKTSYSVTVGTIFHSTKLDLQKWFLGISLILNAKKSINARQLARDLEVNKNTAWYMAIRIRKAFAQDRELLSGIVEMDEIYIRGKPSNSSKKDDNDTPKPLRERGIKKASVVGMVERDGKVKVFHKKEDDLTTKKLKAFVHSQRYVEDDIYTNTIENFWTSVKRGIVDQFHEISLHYLKVYSESFRFVTTTEKTMMCLT